MRADQLATRMDQCRAGDAVSVPVARREQLQRVSPKLGAEPLKHWRLEVDPAATDQQKKMRNSR